MFAISGAPKGTLIGVKAGLCRQDAPSTAKTHGDIPQEDAEAEPPPLALERDLNTADSDEKDSDRQGGGSQRCFNVVSSQLEQGDGAHGAAPCFLRILALVKNRAAQNH